MSSPDLELRGLLWLRAVSGDGFPGGSVVVNMPADTGDVGLNPGSGRSPGEGNGNPLQYSCLGNPRDRGAWWAIVHGVKKSRHSLATKQQYQPDVRLQLPGFTAAGGKVPGPHQCPLLSNMPLS